MEYLLVKALHVISSTILFGTGLGSAFYMWRADKEGDLHAIAFATRNVVRADWYFTAPAVVVQPVTGLVMVFMAGHDLTSLWLLASIILYLIAGACWIPVVYLQIRMEKLAQGAVANGTHLPEEYHADARRWVLLGIPAFLSLVIVFFLMTIKPTL